ncbi:MAG: NUDIX domain-containing protein [Myxococcales bacterium]|nr:NUDIX domain-containing protein [Myxococcales bacterium]MCB9651340.1 NUDIX domain-containing protein [Deltaproteobacteria bacterium]
MTVVEKAFAYFTHQHCVLVFEQPDHPAAGIQVPAGTIHPAEPPEEAAIREAREESGLYAFGPATFLGRRLFDPRPFGKQVVTSSICPVSRTSSMAAQ